MRKTGILPMLLSKLLIFLKLILKSLQSSQLLACSIILRSSKSDELVNDVSHILQYYGGLDQEVSCVRFGPFAVNFDLLFMLSFFRLCHDCSSVGLNNLEGSPDVLHSVNWIGNVAGNLGAIFICYLLKYCCKMY